MLTDAQRERKGVLLVLCNAAIWALYPVVVHQGTQALPPLSFAAMSIALAVVVLLIIISVTGKVTELKIKPAHTPMIMVAVFIVIIPMTLFFLGAKLTSGANTALLAQAEIIFTVLITPLFGERTTLAKLLGAGAVVLGGSLIMFNGTWQLNLGDVLIVLSTAFYPIGNFYAKRALTMISGSTLLFARFAIALLPITALAWLFERDQFSFGIFLQYWPYVVMAGFVSFVLEKLMWYKGLRLLDISKAISLINFSPLFSLLILVVVFDERIPVLKWVGVLIILVGLVFTVQRPSVPISKTKYGNYA